MARRNLAEADLVASVTNSDAIMTEVGGSMRRLPIDRLMEQIADNFLDRVVIGHSEEECAYGVSFDTTVSSPSCTRILNMNLHRQCPIQNRMRGCLLNDDGKVVKYLDSSDWTGETRDGSKGQVMVEIPRHYRRFVTDGTKREVRLSEYPLPGYDEVPICYVSAYQATVQRSTSMLASVANATADYRGGGNQTAYDGTAKTLLGRPATSINRTSFRAYARKRKPATSEWNCMTYDIQKTLYWLFVVEYATLNSQAGFNAQPTSDGYRQGGLGAGVTSLDGTKWSNFNGYNPFIPCGHTDSLGNGTGVVSYTMPSAYDTTTTTVSVPRYHGVENPFGHIWQWTDGVNVRISPDAPSGDGLSAVFVCHDPARFSDTGYDGYHHVGNMARANGYVREMIFGQEGDIAPLSSLNGGSTIYHCDYFYTDIPAAATLRGLLFGGVAYSGAAAGLVYAHSNLVPSVANAYFGSRLCFIPENA